MSARKLTDSDKREILKLYRQPEETTSTLATRYNVSNSTISRFLKSTLSEQEYEVLIQQKRANRNNSHVPEQVELKFEEPTVEPVTKPVVESVEPEPISSTPVITRRRKRSSVASEPVSDLDETPSVAPVPSVSVPSVSVPPVQESPVKKPRLEFPTSGQDVDSEDLEDNYDVETRLLEEMLGEELTDLEDEDEELDLDEDDDDEGEDEDWEEEENAYPIEMPRRIFPRTRTAVQVLPLSEASIPRTCYLVIDRSAELIARPLREFSDLGQIPSEEYQERTLPIFDNHRVARRFSNRTQRVIKVPDGRMFYKTSSQLKAKGITRLLIDGQVYSLSP